MYVGSQRWVDVKYEVALYSDAVFICNGREEMGEAIP